MENVIVSQLLSETDLIDILFHTCDEQNTGRVPVSALITYLHKMTGSDVQHREAVQKLALCLDPEGQNRELDLVTYRHGMHTWIEQLRTQLSDHSSADPAVGLMDEKSLSNTHLANSSSPYLKETSGFGDVQTEPTSVDDSCEQMELEGGQDLDREVEEELRHCNKRLLQENSKLQTQLDAQDDTLAALTHDKGCLEDKIRRLQDVTDLQSEVSTENEDLKCLLSHCQEESKGLLNRILQLERDNTGLQVQLHDAEQKCYKLTSDGEAVNNAIKELRRTVSEQKIALQEADSAQKSLEMELAEREQILADVKSSLGELSKINKELKKNNEELQLHLAQTQQQLARHSLQPQQSLVKRTLSSLDGNESDDENSDDDDDDDHIRSLPFAVTELSSVPMESFSIHTEIKDMLEESQNVPCPLSGKEQQETLTSDDELLTTAVVDMDIADFLEHLPDITLDAFMAVLTKKYQPQGWRSTTVVARSEDRLLAAQVGCTKEQAETPEDEETSVSNAEANGASSGTCYTQGSDSINERLKQFLQKVKDLKEENQRLQSVHQAAVDSVVDMEGDVLSRVTSADTRIMVLRDILQEERTQKSRLQGQVVTLKKILGIVHKKDNLEFDTVRDTLCRQQDKIEHLKRSNLELAEKYHKAELKITDLQEEAHEATLQLEREKHRCSKLEEAVSSSTLARQLDLREIWRLVQKDVESEFLTTQDGSELSSSSEEIKERILQEIKARDSSRLSRMGMGEGSMKTGAPMSVPLQRKFGGYNCGYKCPSPSTPLVDALAIDFFNGNYCPRPRKSRGTRGSDHEAYMNYLRLSCEDVDCMECRAYRLGLDFHGGVASCPSLQLKLAQDLAVPLGRLHGVGTALDNNYNSQPGCGHFQRDCDGGVASTAEDSSVTATTNDNTCSHSSNATKTSPPPPGVFSREAGSAVHRRLDFRKGAISGNTTTDSLTSCASTSMDSTNSNSNSDYHHHQHPLSRSAAPPTREQTDNRISSSSPSSQQQCSPAGFRRLSFLAAVDKSKKTDADWNRRPSYRAAVEPGYLPGGDPSDNDQLPSCHVDGRGENKMVTFQLGGGENGAGGGGGGGGHALSLSSSSFSSSTDSDGPFWGHCAASGALRGPNSQPRKLSILLEEEDADDSQKTPEKRSSLSSVSRSPTPTPHHFDFNSNAEIHESDPLDAPNESSDGQRSGAHSSLHGSPQGGSPRITADVKVILPATEGNNRPDMMMAGQPAACNADNMPAHFKHRSELPTITSQPPPPSSSSSSTSAADTSTTLTTAAATTTPYSTVTASNVSTLAPQPLILVPGSPPHTPPQTPRVAHDGTQPAAVPSRLAKLRQNNLAKKREQMKTMKMPELSEHAESSSDTEQQQPPPSVGNGGATLPSSSSPKTPLVSARSGDNEDSCRMDSNSSGGGGGSGGVEVVRPPSPSKDPVTPSIPESFLKKLGLSAADKNVVNGETSVDQLPDKQLESRFNSLALAFKTDRLTLDQRLGIQERSRDIAEQNIDKELQGLRDAVEILNQLCADERVQEVISKIQHHLDILEHSVARVSSRAEVFGAVQQEKRMCLAMEVMITYTENIRRLRSTEQSDVEEARRILSSSRQNFSLDTLSIGDRRSASVCAALSNPRTARRRSEVALPRFFGGAGSPSLHVTSSMESGILSELSQSSHGSTSRSSFADSTEEPRQRFQSATANVTVRNVVTNTLRRASMDRQKNLSLHSTSSLSSSNQSSSRNNSLDKSQDKEQETKQHSQEEEAYRHGYEEGLKASLSRELTDLRDQQATISSSLDQVMDRVESFQDDDKDDSDIDEAVSKVKDAVVKVRLWMSNPNWQSASQTLRKVAAGLFFLLAMLVVVVTFAPLIPAHISLRNHAKSAQ